MAVAALREPDRANEVETVYRGASVALLFVLALFCAGAVKEASAQPSLERPDLATTARFRVGAFYVTPIVDLEEFGIDTNVFNDLENPKSDFTFTLNPALQVAVPIAGRALIRTTPSADVIYYHTFGTERSIGPEISARADVYLGQRLTLFAGSGFQNVRRRPSLEIDVRARHSERHLELGATAALSNRLSLELNGRETAIDFDEGQSFLGVPIRDKLNRNQRMIGLTARYRLSPLTAIHLTGEAATERFPFSADDRNADTTRVVAGVQFSPRALITGSATVGLRRFQTLTDAVPDFQGVTASAALGYSFGGATNISFTAERDVAYSFEILQPYYLAESYGIGLLRHLGGRFEVGVTAARHLYTYRDINTAGSERAPIARGDRTWNYTSVLAYRLANSARVGIIASYWQRQSSSYGFRNYDSLRVGTTLMYGGQR